jgi:hypothetical protein
MSVSQNTVRHIHGAGVRRSPKARSLEFEPNGARRCGSEIEIRQVFDTEDFGEALTPELREQEQRLRAAVKK